MNLGHYSLSVDQKRIESGGGPIDEETQGNTTTEMTSENKAESGTQEGAKANENADATAVEPRN